MRFFIRGLQGFGPVEDATLLSRPSPLNTVRFSFDAVYVSASGAGELCVLRHHGDGQEMTDRPLRPLSPAKDPQRDREGHNEPRQQYPHRHS